MPVCSNRLCVKRDSCLIFPAQVPVFHCTCGPPDASWSPPAEISAADVRSGASAAAGSISRSAGRGGAVGGDGHVSHLAAWRDAGLAVPVHCRTQESAGLDAACVSHEHSATEWWQQMLGSGESSASSGITAIVGIQVGGGWHQRRTFRLTTADPLQTCTPQARRLVSMRRAPPCTAESEECRGEADQSVGFQSACLIADLEGALQLGLCGGRAALLPKQVQHDGAAHSAAEELLVRGAEMQEFVQLTSRAGGAW